VGVNNNEVLDNNGKDEDDNVVDTTTALLPEMIASCVSFINECTSESVTDNINESIRDEEKDECEVSPYMIGGANHGVNSSTCFEQFMELMNCNKLDAVSSLALNLNQLLELGKLSSGSIDSQSKYMSRN
jgi:hypothetical protein